jgi:hypothetical protein
MTGIASLLCICVLSALNFGLLLGVAGVGVKFRTLRRTEPGRTVATATAAAAAAAPLADDHIASGLVLAGQRKKDEGSAASAAAGAGALPARRFPRALLYAYHETPSCAANLRFLLEYGGLEYFPDLAFVLVVNGQKLSVALPGKELPSLIVLRRENEGLDFGAYAAGLRELERVAGSSEGMPSEYGFLNCGVSGPFLPAFLPPGFDWFAAFTRRLGARVRLVGTYVSCLPPGDAGGRGPRVEGHSFFTDAEGLRVLRKAHVMRSMADKYDAIVNGEYGLTRAMFAAGYTIDTPLYRYQGVNWEDKANWDCNMNRFVGRGGGYEQGSVNPFETVFFKRVWPTLSDPDLRAVRYEETARYMRWRGLWASGGGGYHADEPPPPPPPPYYDPDFAPHSP